MAGAKATQGQVTSGCVLEQGSVVSVQGRGPSTVASQLCHHEQVKQLRLEREREKAMREQELEMLQREKEAEHFKTWEEQEDNFHLQQAKLR